MSEPRIVTFTTDFQSVPIKASGQDDWQTSEVPIAEDLRGHEAAVNYGGLLRQ